MTETKYDRTHRHLILCGIRLLQNEAYDRVSVASICQEAGVSRQNFYQHFSSKEQLVAEYYISALFLTDAMMDCVTLAPDPWSAMIRLQLLYLQLLCSADQAELLSHYLSYQLTDQSPIVSEHENGEMETLLTSLIRQLQTEHIARNTADAYYLQKAIRMVLSGHLFNWCSNGGRPDMYSDFFWTLEAVLDIDDTYRGAWKLEESSVSTFLRRNGR